MLPRSWVLSVIGSMESLRSTRQENDRVAVSAGVRSWSNDEPKSTAGNPCSSGHDSRRMQLPCEPRSSLAFSRCSWSRGIDPGFTLAERVRQEFPEWPRGLEFRRDRMDERLWRRCSWQCQAGCGENALLARLDQQASHRGRRHSRPPAAQHLAGDAGQ